LVLDVTQGVSSVWIYPIPTGNESALRLGRSALFFVFMTAPGVVTTLLGLTGLPLAARVARRLHKKTVTIQPL
jgi:hypothetical protein